MAVPSSVIEDIVRKTNAENVSVGQTLQSLWSGYGGIVQLDLTHSKYTSAVLKLINPPVNEHHPRGWNSDRSRTRKLRSYEVETCWYESYSARCNASCRVPYFMATGEHGAGRWILMEDLNHTFAERAAGLSINEAEVCLQWLASFHAQFIGVKTDGLWPIGTYWQLETREDEFNAMPEGLLKTAAAKLHSALNSCPYQSIVHGDAKVANFCFNDTYSSVCAVDFQYVGGGVGIKDVAYFLGSCIEERDLEQYEQRLLDSYFDALKNAVQVSHSSAFADSVVQAWAELYAIAWTDFYRFLLGWSPGHNKINRYTEQLAKRAFAQLNMDSV